MIIYYFCYEVGTYTKKFFCSNEEKLKNYREKLLDKKDPLIQIGEIKIVCVDEVIVI